MDFRKHEGNLICYNLNSTGLIPLVFESYERKSWGKENSQNKEPKKDSLLSNQGYVCAVVSWKSKI